MARIFLVLTLSVLLGSCGTAAAPDAGACDTSGGPVSLPYPTDPCTSANAGEARCEGGCGWECSDGCWIAFCDGPCWGDAGL